jgi:tetratricopeptide (TPR) repeat protein/DNA-binding SARP family transcriptional activator
MLGPVELWADGKRHDLGSRKERCVLAVLLWENGHPVDADALIQKVWGDDRPRKALSSLYSNVSRLRGKLQAITGDARDWSLRHAGAYVLDVSSDEVDLRQFRGLRDAAKAAAGSGDDDRAFVLLDQAERLWRGVPLAGVDGAWAERVRLRLDEDRYSARLERVGVGLRLGRYADLIGEAIELTELRPLDENPVEYLMRALFMSARRADALKTYMEFRNRYADAVGNEPSAKLRELQQQMLQDDPKLASTRPVPPASVSAPRNTMPRDNPDFTGRGVELDRISGWLDDSVARSTVPVIVISGMAGVGKSALAVHASRVHEDRYPDQLYVQLRGHAHDEDPMDPGTALAALLRAIDVPETIVPAGVEDRAALWRSRLAGRKVLILLDDAINAAQVRPLLPSAPGCLVLITTQRNVLDLAGSRRLSLEPMPPADAAALFARAADKEQTEEPAVASVLRLCDYLPLEIQLAGSELRRHPAWNVGDLAARLREIHAEDRPVGAALALSCHYLTPEQRLLLRRLVLHPGPDFSRFAATAMAADQSPAATRRALEALADYHLIEEPAADRFAFHDLIRQYAWHLAHTEDSVDDRQQTMRRMADYYIWLADSADRALCPFRRRYPAAVRYIPASPPSLRTPHDHQKWLAAEQVTMLAVARHVAVHGHAEQASLLAHALAWFLDSTSCWVEAADLHQRAADAWQATANPAGQVRALTDLCRVLGRMGRYEEASDCAQQTLAIVRAAADHAGEAEILDNQGLILWLTSRYADALSSFNDALTLWRTLGNKYGEAEVLIHSASVLWHISDYPDALRQAELALGIYRELSDLRGEANALNNLGDIHQGADRYERALESYQQALGIYRGLGDRLGEAVVLNNFGNICVRMGQAKDALAHFRTALDIYRDLGNRRCEADALNNMGTAYRQLGHYDDALDQHQKALVLAHDIDERYLEALSHHGSGAARLAAGSYAAAIGDYRAALDISQRIGDRYQEAQALDGLAQATLRIENATAAREFWRAALAIYVSIQKERDADEVRARLRDLPADGDGNAIDEG